MNNEQFWKLLEPIHPELESFCRKLEGNREDGDDLYQEGLLIGIRKIDNLRDRKSFRPWLYRILINRYKNRRRGWWWKNTVGLIPSLAETSGYHDPQDRYDQKRLCMFLLSSLAAEERALVVLNKIEGWTYRELSELYKKPEGTIKARIHRALKKMRRKLECHLKKQEEKFSTSEGFYALQRSKTSDE